MSIPDATATYRPVAIAPAPPRPASEGLGDFDDDAPRTTMPYTCQTCAKRKVKCDKVAPICSSCTRGKLECTYQAPPPRRRKRKLSGDVFEKLARYERILQQNGLLPLDADSPPLTEENPQELISIRWNEPETSKTGKILASEGRTRYIDSSLWRDLGDELQRVTDDEDEDEAAYHVVAGAVADPLTGAFIGSQVNLLQYHPTQAEALLLWRVHIESVEPICKILHIPSTFKMVKSVSQQPETASKSDECILFAVYHFAVFAMEEEDCMQKFGQARVTLMRKYHFATRQALVNASFLKTTEMSVMQALVLFLLSCRHSYDPHTYWILTGVAIRISQRIGLHRDPESLGLPPFDVQMRRRLFYQLLPLDGIASQISGTGIGVMPETWDTQSPLNLNDDQIWPGMTETPEEQKGPTEMIYCLARSCIGKFVARAGKSMRPKDGKIFGQFKDHNEFERVINEAESEVEEKYIRYCDIVEPLHFLTLGVARSAITAMRLRSRLVKARNNTVTDAGRREIFQLSLKIMDTDTAAYAHAALKDKFLWYIKPFFTWGSWDSMIFVLTTLRKSDLLSSTEIDTAWNRVEQAYNNHGELLESKRALQLALGRITLDAWKNNPPSLNSPEPAFVTTLRSFHDRSQARRHSKNLDPSDGSTTLVPSTNPSPTNDENALFGSIVSGMDGQGVNNFNFDNADWAFWDNLIRDNQLQQSQY